MTVLCEAYSVIIRMQSVDQHFPGGRDTFTRRFTSNTYCSDGDLARVGFMTPDDVEEFVNTLEAYGLQFGPHEGRGTWGTQGRRDSDIVVVSQLHGPTTPCPWIHCSQMRISATGSVVGARLVTDGVPETDPEEGVDLQTPAGWTYEKSISASMQFVSFEDMPGRMKFLHEEDGLDVYLDTETGKEMFVGRS